ncbi:MAG: aminotransferase class V-fold PLP-dependent enzyme [Verrucomicrobiota bacterium]
MTFLPPDLPNPLTLDLLWADDALRHRLFPVTAERNFQAHAGVAPLSGPAEAAVRELAERGARDMQEPGNFLEYTEDARALAARFLGVKTGEVALLGPTALGLSLVANGLDWEPGDEVVFYQQDYPANVYPWAALERLGVRPVRIETETPGKLTPELVARHLTPKTKLVALASCHFLTGYRLDVSAIGELAHRHGALFCLDAIQSLGATEVDLTHVDFLSADSHKWLLGPLGMGVVVVKENVMDRLRPTLLGAWNVQSPDFIAQETITLEHSARRYEPGSLNFLGLVGMLASMELLERFGLPAIERRLLDLRAFAREKITARGGTLVHAAEPESATCGIISLRLDRESGTAAFRRLQEANIAASLRHDAAKVPHLRLSPHFYNTEADLEAALELVFA